jgi:hypothetical protein
MYVKPVVVRFGLLREVTQVGWNYDCDGGWNGVSSSDGDSWGGCKRSS